MADTAAQHISTQRRSTGTLVAPCHPHVISNAQLRSASFLHRLGTYSSRVLHCWSVREAPLGERIMAEQSKRAFCHYLKIRNICNTSSHTRNGHAVGAIQHGAMIRLLKKIRY